MLIDTIFALRMNHSGSSSDASPSIAFATALGLFILFIFLTNYSILLLFSSLVREVKRRYNIPVGLNTSHTKKNQSPRENGPKGVRRGKIIEV